MGQKINPHSLRVGMERQWESQWYAEDNKKPSRNLGYKWTETLRRPKKIKEYGISRIGRSCKRIWIRQKKI